MSRDAWWDYLNQARHHIGVVCSQLDVREEPCEACGLKRYVNWEEHQLAERLRGMLGKLESIMAKLDAPKKGPENDHVHDESQRT